MSGQPPLPSLVLFDDAVRHVLRVARILSLPRGSAVLVGVGGSGKQTLCRLSAFIAGLDPFTFTSFASGKKVIKMNDLQEDLKALYLKTGQ